MSEVLWGLWCSVGMVEVAQVVKEMANKGNNNNNNRK